MMITSILSGLLTVLCASETPNRPPPLTFEKHVDYIAWCNTQLSRGKTENALPLYKKLLPDDSGNGGIQPLKGAAKEQYDQIGTGNLQVQNRIWDAKDYPDFADHLRESAVYLDTLERASKLRDFFQPIPPDSKLLVDHLGVSSSPILRASKLTTARAWMKQGNQAKAILKAQEIALRSAGHMQQSGFVLGDLFGTSVRAQTYHSVLSALHNGILAGDDVRRSYMFFLERDPGSSNWNSMLNFEWAFALDMLQFLYPGGKLDDARQASLEAALQVSYAGENGQPGLEANPRPTVAIIDQHHEELHQIVRGSPRATKSKKMRRYFDARSAAFQKNAFMRHGTGVLTRAYEITVQAEAHRRGVMLALALRAHHNKHGEWPENLKRIDKKLGLKDVKKLRIDPFSGKYFKYSIKDGEPLFYSIGADGNDDGGRHDPRWGEGEAGGDFVFWPQS